MFRQKSIQYADLNTDLNIDPRHMRIGEKSGKKIATIVINLSGVEVLINEQKEVYSRVRLQLRKPTKSLLIVI